MNRRFGLVSAALIAALILACVVPPAHAASALDRRYGTPELGVSARLRGMGGAGAALGDGGLGIVDNPLSPLLSARKGTMLVYEFSGDVARMSENRMVPLYDTFDSYVHQTAIAVNDHGYGSMNFGVSINAPFLAGFALGLASVEAFDPRYDYQDERRSTATTDQIVSQRYISTQGTLRDNTIAIAHGLPLGFAAGAAAHIYLGTLTDRDALVPRQNGVSGRTTMEHREMMGGSFSLGAAWRSERLTAAASWETGPRVRENTAMWLNDSLTFGPVRRRSFWPPRMHLGGAYRPRNTMRTTFVVDGIWTGWSNVTDLDLPSQRLHDTWDVRFGVEHLFLRDLPGRMGFRYERSPVLKQADRAWFALGTGWHIDRLVLDGALEVGKRVSRQEPVWPRAEQAGAVGAGDDEVQDTVARVTLGVKVGLP